jgi:hypothetical protein
MLVFGALGDQVPTLGRRQKPVLAGSPVLVGTTGFGLHHFTIDGCGCVPVPFFSKMGLSFGFIFSIRGVGSGVGSFFIFQFRPIRVFNSVTFGSSSNIQILE